MIRPDPGPVFIHSSFRTCSTWFWAQLRQSADAMGYCEIFHEGLAILERSQIMALGPSSWRSGHPPMPPYNLEFVPLIRDGAGVEGFSASMAFESFIPPSGPTGPISEGESVYIASLITNARTCGKIPVLADTRSLGRVVGMKAQFPGLHVVLYRNLFDQWCSYTDQAFFGTTYFLSTINTTIQENRHDPILKQIGELFPCEKLDASDPNLFYRFVFLHLYLYGHAAEAADLLIDVNRLASDVSYRDGIANQIVERVNLPVDLSASRFPVGFSLIKPTALTDLGTILRVMSPMLLKSMPSEVGRTFIARAIADLVQEYDCSRFYTDRLVTATTGLVAEREKLEAERAELIVDRDRLQAQIEALTARGGELTVDQGRLQTQVETLTARQGAYEAERKYLSGEDRADLNQRFGQLSAQLDLVIAERSRSLVSTPQHIGMVKRLIAKCRRHAFRHLMPRTKR